MNFPVGLLCFILAAIITLPVPLGHVVPGTAVAVMALGLVERDGVAVTLGFALTLGALTLVTVASISAIVMLQPWIEQWFIQ